jgi:hypothetical protein
MMAINVQVQAGDKRFDYAKEVSVNSSWENLTDTAKIIVPRKISYEGKTIVQGESLFSVGQKVEIKAGLDERLMPIYQGFITTIKPHENIEFACEDAMWKFKQSNINYSNNSATLKDLLHKISPIPFEAIDATLGSIRFTNRTPAYILKELRDTYGIYSWVRNGTLYSGLKYRPELQKTARFVFGENIINPYDLEYRKKEDVKIKVKAISIKPNNKRESVEFGDDDGAQRTLHFYNVPKSELTARAKAEIERLAYTGFYGKFKTFGIPAMNHGDIAHIIDNTNPDRNGKYLIKAVEKSLSVDGGYMQHLTLDSKV